MKPIQWAFLFLFGIMVAGCGPSSEGVVESVDEAAEQAAEDEYSAAQEEVEE